MKYHRTIVIARLGLHEVRVMILLYLLAFAALVSAGAIGFHIGHQMGKARGLARGRAQATYTRSYNRHKDS